jgi:O-antigen/teichoic acid export membrane protein
MCVAMQFWYLNSKRANVSIVYCPWSKLLKSCIPLLITQIMLLSITWSSTLALGVWGSKNDVGIFGAAIRASMLISFLLVSMNSIIAPKISALYVSNNLAELESMARKSAALLTVIATPIIFFIILFPDMIMSIFGNEFSEGGQLLLILALGQFINVGTGSVGYLLIMSGNEVTMRNNTIIFGLLAIILNIWLVPRFGAMGAALATAIGMSLLNISACVLVWRKLKIIPIPFIKKRCRQYDG